MIYLIYGNQSATIKNRIKKIAKESLPFIDDLNFVKYDATHSLVQDVISDCNSLPLGYEKKIVSLENAYFLLKPLPKTKVEAEQKYSVLTNYISNPNPSSDLIISVTSLDINQDSDIFILLKNKATVFQISDPDEKTWNEYVKKYIKEKLQVDIDNDAARELAIRTSGDVVNFQNNANKLALYTDHITFDDVCLMVPRPLEENAFLLFNYLLNRQSYDARMLFKDLKANNVEPVTLISMLANQFRLLSQVIYLAKRKVSIEESAKILNIKEVRVKILRKYLFTIGENKIFETLETLFNLDYNIKSGLVDRFYAFELFLINF